MEPNTCCAEVGVVKATKARITASQTVRKVLLELLIYCVLLGTSM
jgi:hypothetical protein